MSCVEFWGDELCVEFFVSDRDTNIRDELADAHMLAGMPGAELRGWDRWKLG